MRIEYSAVRLCDIETPCLVVPWCQDEPGWAWKALDESGCHLTSLEAEKDLEGKHLELRVLFHPSATKAKQIILVGLGKKSDLSIEKLRNAATAVSKHLAGKNLENLVVTIPGLLSLSDEASSIVDGLIVGLESPALYKNEEKVTRIEKLIFIGLDTTDQATVTSSTVKAEIIAEAVNSARRLVNQAPRHLTPSLFAEQAGKLFDKLPSVQMTVFSLERILKERMDALASVARGSSEEPRMVILEYNGTDDDTAPTLCLVGKGITFDSGGLSLKPSESMIDMKADMAGAAAVLSSVRAIATLGLRVRVTGLIALSENMPGAGAMKLGDVLTARNGTTIEVHNTDAEGRLVLADALSYATDLGASHIVDLATLTGACVVALGTRIAGVMSNSDDWAKSVLNAAHEAGERFWQLPMCADFDDQLKSDVADVKNVGTRWGGAITAAKFLERFVDDTPWVHLDIAGPAWSSDSGPGHYSGGTGAAVRTLVKLAENYSL